MNRETWLNLMAQKLAPRFEELGFPLPAYRVSVGFTSGGKDSRANAECWNSHASGDGVFEILISPGEADAPYVTALLFHELTHAAVGFDQGHKGNFARVMKAAGMKPPMTSTCPTDVFNDWVAPFIAELGPFPHAKLSWGSDAALKVAFDDLAKRLGKLAGDLTDEERGQAAAEGPKMVAKPGSTRPPKQTTRLKKAICSQCGYTVRVTAKWLEFGPPGCPQHGAMDVDVDLPEDDQE